MRQNVVVAENIKLFYAQLFQVLALESYRTEKAKDLVKQKDLAGHGLGFFNHCNM